MKKSSLCFVLPLISGDRFEGSQCSEYSEDARVGSARRRPIALANPHSLAPTLLAVLMLLSGCSTVPQPEGILPPPLFVSPDLKTQAAGTQAAETMALSQRRTLLSEAPAIPKAGRTASIKPPTSTGAVNEMADITLAFDQLPLPSFIQVVFGEVLKKNFSLDPSLITRADLVTLRTGSPQNPAQVLATTRMLLKSYGVAVQEMGDFYRIVPDTNQTAYLPEIRRGRAQPDVPLPMRPVFDLVELTSVKHSEVSTWLKAMFGTRLTIQEDPGRNALLLSGQSAEIMAALEAIQVLDQPLMRSRSSQLITPGSLGVDDLAKRLIEILSAEGYGVAMGSAAGVPISLVSIPASNALLVFALDPAVLGHVVEWATKLDSLDNNNRRSGNYFSYEVRYADAQALAKTLQELMAGQAAPVGGAIPIGTPQRQAARIVVNPATNSLIVNSSNPDEYAQLLSLMKTLDKPSKSAMIEVIVAEVRVQDKSQLGLEWNFGPSAVGNGSAIGGTSGGLSLGTGGLSLAYLNSAGVVRAKLNALASDNRARILSTPRVMARNGEAATIQVGQEVPIITSQQSTATGTTTGTGVLQTIQYRSTGVILRVKPIIFAGRVELDVQQEVSAASSTTTGVNVSPTFSTRKIDTKVSIRDGATVALGGLISRNENKGQAGLPWLRDIPIAGQLFRTDTKDTDETELIILITPYVVENDLVAEQVTQAFRGQLGAWATPKAGPVAGPKSTGVPQMAEPAPAAALPGALPATLPPEPVPLLDPQLPTVDVPTAPLAPVAPMLPADAKPVSDVGLLEELRKAAQGRGDSGKPPAKPAVKTK